jgi:sugar lactone lactonase YvrE
MENFTVSLEELAFTGQSLYRPECVLCTAKGNIYCADWRGGVTCLHPDGSQESFLADAPDMDIKPNGIALCRDGSFLLANLGDDGGLYRLYRSGVIAPILTEIDGKPLPPSNYVMVDEQDRFWLTVSTRRTPRALGYRPDVNDGFIVLIDNKGARIVADGLGYTNEIQFDAENRWLYVNETFGRRMSRFRVGQDGSLKDRETVAEFGKGVFPDGLTFDAEGAVWVTSIVSNRVVRITPDGRQQKVLEDLDPAHVEYVEKAFIAGSMGRPHLDNVKSKKLRNISSLAFGGPDLKTVYLGCLLGDSLATFRSPVPGRPPVHWYYD